jgi:ribosomal protein S20
MKLLLIIVLFFFSFQTQMQQRSFAQVKKQSLVAPPHRAEQQRSTILAIFKNVEYGLQKSSVEEFEKALGSMVSIAIGAGERGYFSKNQAASVLSGYVMGRRATSFQFSRISEKGTAPFATGRLLYIQKGNQESVQVYVSLTRQDSRWVISQFNIY